MLFLIQIGHCKKGHVRSFAENGRVTDPLAARLHQKETQIQQYETSKVPTIIRNQDNYRQKGKRTIKFPS